MPRHARPSLFAPALLLVLAACDASPAPSSIPLASSRPGPAFRLEIDEPVGRTFLSDAAPVTVACELPASGPWTFLYTSLSPSLDITLRLYDGAATAPGSSNFRLDISPGESLGLPPYFIDQLGTKSGSGGSTGTVDLRENGTTEVIDVSGIASARNLGTQDLSFHLTCPIADA